MRAVGRELRERDRRAVYAGGEEAAEEHGVEARVGAALEEC